MGRWRDDRGSAAALTLPGGAGRSHGLLEAGRGEETDPPSPSTPRHPDGRRCRLRVLRRSVRLTFLDALWDPQSFLCFRRNLPGVSSRDLVGRVPADTRAAQGVRTPQGRLAEPEPAGVRVAGPDTLTLPAVDGAGTAVPVKALFKLSGPPNTC